MTEQLQTTTSRRAGPVRERFDALEADARERLHSALMAGEHQLSRLDGALAKVSPETWSATGVARRLESLRARAEEASAKAMRRIHEMPARAVLAFAQRSRPPVQNLARELQRLASLVEPHAGPKGAADGAVTSLEAERARAAKDQAQA